MLTYLQIRDFAIIDSIELDLRPGLTVLTGETGAGKSILVDALQIIAGGRAGAEVVRANTERAEPLQQSWRLGGGDPGLERHRLPAGRLHAQMQPTSDGRLTGRVDD